MTDQQSSKKEQTSWSRDQLVAMLKNREAESVRLILKQGDTEVQRVMHDNKVCVSKLYRKNLAANQSRELSFLFDLNHLNNKAITNHIVPYVSIDNRQTLEQVNFYTEWRGFDLAQWHILLGKHHPYMNNVLGLLSLVHGILDATSAFHAEGYVHNDLHCGNLVMDYTFDKKTNKGELNLKSLSMIDFEFSLKPRRAKYGNETRLAPVWLDQNGNEILLHPLFHSEYVCGFETEQVLKNKKYVQVYKRDARGAHIPIPDAIDIRSKVGFGVDFFTLAYELRELIAQAKHYWSTEDVRKNDAAHDYLLALPDVLEAYNVKPDASCISAPPHLEMMAEIRKFVGTPVTLAEFTLPQESGVQAEAAAPTMLNTDGKQTRVVKKFRTHLPLATVIGIASVAGAAWLMPDAAIDIKQKLIALITQTKSEKKNSIAESGGGNDLNGLPTGEVKPSTASSPPLPKDTQDPTTKESSPSGLPSSSNHTEIKAPIAPQYPNQGAAEVTLNKWKASTYGSTLWETSLKALLDYQIDGSVSPSQRAAIFDAIKVDYASKSQQIKQQAWWSKNAAPDQQAMHWLSYSRIVVNALNMNEVRSMAQLNLFMAQASGKSYAGKLASPPVAARQQSVEDLAQRLSSMRDLPEQEFLHKTAIDAATLLYQLMQASQHSGDALTSPLDIFNGIKKVADLPDQNLQILVGYAASCFLPKPDHALALVYFKKAQTPGLYPVDKDAIKQLPTFIELSTKKDIACS